MDVKNKVLVELSRIEKLDGFYNKFSTLRHDAAVDIDNHLATLNYTRIDLEIPGVSYFTNGVFRITIIDSSVRNDSLVLIHKVDEKTVDWYYKQKYGVTPSFGSFTSWNDYYDYLIKCNDFEAELHELERSYHYDLLIESYHSFSDWSDYLAWDACGRDGVDEKYEQRRKRIIESYNAFKANYVMPEPDNDVVANCVAFSHWLGMLALNS